MRRRIMINDRKYTYIRNSKIVLGTDVLFHFVRLVLKIFKMKRTKWNRKSILRTIFEFRVVGALFTITACSLNAY